MSYKHRAGNCSFPHNDDGCNIQAVFLDIDFFALLILLDLLGAKMRMNKT